MTDRPGDPVGPLWIKDAYHNHQAYLKPAENDVPIGWYTDERVQRRMENRLFAEMNALSLACGDYYTNPGKDHPTTANHFTSSGVTLESMQEAMDAIDRAQKNPWIDRGPFTVREPKDYDDKLHVRFRLDCDFAVLRPQPLGLLSFCDAPTADLPPLRVPRRTTRNVLLPIYDGRKVRWLHGQLAKGSSLKEWWDVCELAFGTDGLVERVYDMARFTGRGKLGGVWAVLVWTACLVWSVHFNRRRWTKKGWL